MVDGGAGGGGAGGVAHCTSLTLTAGTYPVYVGGDPVDTSSGGGQGTPSIFNSLTTTGWKNHQTRLMRWSRYNCTKSPWTIGTDGSGGGGQGFQTLDLEVLEHNQDNLTHQILQTTEVMVDQVLLLVVEAVVVLWRSTGNDGVHGKQLPQFAQPLFGSPHPYTSQPRWETSGYYGGGGSTNPGNPNPLGGGGVPGTPDPSNNGEDTSMV